ncbi:Aminotransferase class I/classII large domain-containing protein [Caenorhabditis elegans]|nr:Aminotransferase class I/classII domain-containing protein [Caenorhabditis elegans]CCA65609.1 Aminotransferase class I/classII domain-containing protein [Caenorhabditis elegans]|eukprot:NP_001256364.1 Uncharacterized protein CELE_T04F3.1 [Caenorhabditis elegans]
MPRRREKFVEITKTVTVTEIVNGAPDKHPSSCEVKVTNVSPAGPHPVNVSIKHLHEKWHSCEELDRSDNGEDLGKGTVIRIQETHKPFNCTQKKHQTNKFVYEDVINTKMESSTKSRQPPSANSTLFNRSSDNIIDLEFRHPILRETSEKKSERTEQKANGNNGTRRRFADLRKRVSTTTKTSVTETENVTTTRRSSSAHSTHSKRSSAKPEVHTLYYRKFVDEETKGADDDSSDSGSVIIYRDAVTRRSRSADPLQNSSPTMSPIAPPRKRLGREESLHYYRDDDEVIQEQSSTEKSRRVTVKSPEPGNTSVSMNDNVEGRNLTAGITSISMNDSCTDTSYESRFSTIPRARSSPPGNHRVNHIQVNVIGPIRVSEPESRHPVVGSVGEDVTMDIYIERRRSGSNPRRDSHVSFETLEAPPKPPRRSKYDEHIRIGDPIATSTPMTTIERKQTREERVSTESGQSSRKSTRSSRPPDINIIECETFLKETRSPARTPATPIVVINQTPSSRRSSQDLLGEPGQRRRKSTVTDIDWYAAFNMKDPSSPTKIARPSFASHNEERKASRDLRRRASDSSMIGIPPADIDLNQIFLCTVPPEIKKDEKCQCNACRLIRMSEAERAVRIERSGRSRQSRSFTRTTEFETRSSTLPSRHRTAPVDIELEDIFNPKPFSHPSANSKPPTPPNRRRHPPSASVAHSQSSFVDESPSQHFVTTTIDRNQVTPVTTTTTNMRESGPLLHENSHNQLLSSSDNWVAQMMNDASEWENNVSSRKSSILSTSSTSARKASVARRISVDELTKPEKRKSRQAVPLPPSDVSIDDIFTALTPRKEEVQSERKTFIVTRKQRAQDVDAIDFEKDRETPIAPPRSGKRKSDATENQPEITLELDVEKHEIDSSKVSTSTINLNDESMETRNTNDSKDSFDDEVNPRNQRLVVEIPFSEPRVTSTATIQLESSDVAGENSENKRPVISMRSKSEIAKKEKDAQRSGFVIIPHSKEHILDESNISMDDVFNTTPHDQCRVPDIDADSSKHTSSDSREVSTVTINLDNVFPTEEPKLVAKDNCEIEAEEERIGKRIKQFERTTGEQEISKNSEPTEDEMPDEKDHRTSAVSIDLDKVFVQGTAKKPENDEFDEKIKRGIAEFERSKQEKEVQRSGVAETSHSGKHIFDESNISMDDVFNTSQKYKSDEKLSTPERTVEPEVSTATMNLDNIISASGIATREENTNVLEEEERIQKRVEEFKKTTENLEIQKEVVLTKEEVDNSDVKEHRTSAVNIDLEKVFIHGSSKKPKNDDEKIRRGIAEFERTKQEKEAQRSTVIETSQSNSRIFEESSISMDDVFNNSLHNESQVSEITEASDPSDLVLTSTTFHNVIEEKIDDDVTKTDSNVEEEKEQVRLRIDEFKRPTEEQNLQKEFELTKKEEEYSVKMENRTSAVSIDLDKVFDQSSKETTVSNETDEKIKRGIAEFERSKQEKEVQRSGVAETSHSGKHIFDESNISMDDVFNTSQKYKSDEKLSSPERTVEPEVSTATMNLDNIIFASGIATREENTDVLEEEERIQKRVEEFKKTTENLEIQKEVVLTKEEVDNSDVKEHRTSAVNIDLDDVFIQRSSKHPENDEDDEKIRRGIAEFERTKQEKEAQRSAVIETSQSNKHIFDKSNISMDEVFNESQNGQKDSSNIDMKETDMPEKERDDQRYVDVHRDKKPFENGEFEPTFNGSKISNEPKQISITTINLDNVFPTEEPKLVAEDNCEIEAEEERIRKRIKQFERTTGEQEILKNSEPAEDETSDEKKHRTAAVSIDLDKVFVQGTAKKPENDEFDEKIKRGIAEFERSKQEKEVQRSGVAETSHSSKHIFDESNISMDDVFNTSQKYKSDEKLSTPERTVEPEVSTATMNLDNIIFASGIATREKNTDVLEEEERIQKRVEEFKKTTENLEIQKEVVLTKEEGDNSDVKDHKASAVNIDLDDVFIQRSSKHPENDEDDEKIRRGIAEFERTKQEKEAQRSTVIETQYSSKDMFNESDISLDVVFNTSQKDKSDEKLSSPERTVEPEVSTATVNLDNMVALSKERRKENNETQEEEEQIQKRVEEFKESTEEQKIQKSIELTKEECTSDEKELKTYSGSIDLDKVFIQGSSKKPRNDESDERINRGIAEFERTKQEKEAQRSVVVETSPSNKHISDESSISMDEIFSRSQDNKSTSNFEKSGSIPIIVLPGEEKEVASASINLNGVFLEGKQKTSTDYGREKVNKVQENSGSYSTRHAMDGASISLDDIFNTSSTSQKTETDKIDNSQEFPQLSKPVLKSSISLDDLFNNTSGIEKTTSEKTTTTTTTRTETTTDTYSKRSTSTLVDRFGYETATPPAISIAAISFDQPSSSSPQAFPRSKHQNLSSLTVPGKWNESMMSNTSTISLDDSFNNSFSKSNTSQVYEPRMRKPLTLPVDNWIDNLVSEATNEATKEAPKTPKSDTLNYFRSPTRISQEIKYEWVADMIGDIDRKNKGGHQSEEEHLQKHDSTWVSSVVYRPTLETSAYTLRSSQLNTDCKMEIDLENVFDECLMGKKKDDEHCECSACRLTEQELEEIKKRKIELENMTSEQKIIISEPSDRRKSVDFSNPSQISLNEVFSPEVPLRIETEHAPAPSTSSPPLESTRIYYLSPKVSETVTTTHQWKDAGIPMDEIFSPVSSTADGNRRFSNFYEDRSGWDTIGSEDSGVMSGGDRGRRRSTRITDQVIDEAFQGIFDSQPSTSTAHPKPVRTETHYDDYYITSLQQEDLDATDSEVDGENLDVSTFVDDILGKSMDEAAFLSSTKSLREHTDTSIDRKKSGEKVHSYYRNRTDTSIDKRSKPEVITEDLETSELQDEIMKLVFVEPSVSKSDSSANIKASQNKSTTKPCDEELLEIEIKSEYFLIKGSYSLLIPKSDPLGKMLQKLREQNDSLATLDFSLTRKLKKLLVNCIREKAGSLDMVSMSSQYEGLSSRGQSLIESIDHASATFLKMNVDKYEPTRNPNGVVNFCTAENNICTPLLEDRFKHLELFFPNIEHLVRYPPAGGWPETRRVLVKYFKEFMGAGVTIDELVLTASTRTGYDVTSYCLFEQDDILLTNGPIYTGTISNVQEKAQCQVVCVETDLSNPRLDVKMYEAELNRQIALENTVSGVIIVNPHNPLGVTFPPEQVISLCNWASSKNLRVVIDEVFANSVFDKLNSKFRPFLSYRHRLHRPDSVAWLWSVSKDFGLPGLKFAVIHTTNEGLCQAATKLQMYYPCSPFVQDFAVNLLSDSEWLREFHREVNKRISIHYRYTSDNLKRLEIPFIPAQAGIFVFADFSKHLTSLDSVGELALFERLAEAGVMLTPGVHQKCHVFGWFRIVFACTKEELEEGFRRLYIHLGSQLQPVGTVEY